MTRNTARRNLKLFYVFEDHKMEKGYVEQCSPVTISTAKAVSTALAALRMFEFKAFEYVIMRYERGVPLDRIEHMLKSDLTEPDAKAMDMIIKWG